MKCITINELNELAKTPEKFIEQGECAYFEQISAAADRIFEQREQRPAVLISGPSGSGKTTSAARIAHLLRDKGCKTHIISMDNYFLPLHLNVMPADEEGKIDYESPERMDIPLFREQLEKLINCEEINIPLFDFALQDRKLGMTLKRQSGDLIIIEGIHALNPLLTGGFENCMQSVYVSVRTRVRDGDTLLHPSKIRLMRRLMRDKLYRGRSLTETFDFFKGVERGENLYIMPYKDRADLDIDTFIEYEVSVYRDILLPDLKTIAALYPDYGQFSDIETFLTLLSPLNRNYVPENSLIKEFIG